MPDRLFDRTWRPGHPFRPRLSRTRRICTLTLLVVLSAVIGGYWFLTDPARVRVEAERYLTSLLGGRVEIGRANLSIFEGLRLDDISVYADEPRAGRKPIFTAETFLVRVPPQKLLTGTLEASRIIAISPHVMLVEHRDTGRWNFDSLLNRPTNPATTRRSRPTRPKSLPEILLRDAQVEYVAIDGSKTISTSSMVIEGQLLPQADPSDEFAFVVQTRGPREALGPEVSGRFSLGSGGIKAALRRFEFGQDIKAMLPAKVRSWCEAHAVAGRLEVPELSYAPPDSPGGEPKFHARLEFFNVTLQVQPEEFSSRSDKYDQILLADTFDRMRGVGLNMHGLIDAMDDSVRPGPVTLQKVDGVFEFDQDGVAFSNVVARVEDNQFRLDGKVHGYKPDAPATIRLASLPSTPLTLPPRPAYINSLPPAAREVYDRFRPTGSANLWVQVDRGSPGGKIGFAGEVDILDGEFIFDRFPYPVKRAGGKIVFGPNEKLGYDALLIQNVKAYGASGGPNENSSFTVNGTIGPLDGDAGVDIVIQATNIQTEPALSAAFPRATRLALKSFDAPGKGEFPVFAGDFKCSIERPIGPRMPWTIDTDITLRSATGAMVVFPYEMTGVTGQVKIRDDHVDIVDATYAHDDAKLVMNGRVEWGRANLPPVARSAIAGLNSTAVAGTGDREAHFGTDEPSLRPRIDIVATHVPIDRQLLDALPPTHREWLEKIGIGGFFDLKGELRPKAPTPPSTTGGLASARPSSAAPTTHPTDSNIDFDFDITMARGSIWPRDQTFAVSEVTADLRLSPDELLIRKITGRRADAQFTASGKAAWPENKPAIDLSILATDLALDSPLYALLPAPARDGWDQVHPEGTIDAKLTLAGGASESSPLVFAAELRPKKLRVTPAAVPLLLEDVAGVVTIAPGKVEMRDITAKYGNTPVALSGTGDTNAGSKWSLKLAATDLPAEKKVIDALPTTVRDLARSSEFGGTVDVSFEKLELIPRENSVTKVTPPAGASESATTKASTMPSFDVDFATTIRTKGAKLDVGFPMTDVVGTASLRGRTRGESMSDFAGDLAFDSLKLAGRPMTKLAGEIAKVPDQPAMQLRKLRGSFAGGDLAGQVDFVYPDKGPSRYVAAFLMHNADLKQLIGEDPSQAQFAGQISASLSLEGDYSNAASRRGRGDVSVTGKELYKLPILLGLLQITNLSLPISEPFSEASSRYTVEGERVTFDSIELRAQQMLMTGTGKLDFGNKTVNLTFVTENSGFAKLPLLGELLQATRNELLQIHVKGTLQEPKVSAGVMSTFTTTIDEVFRGGKEK